MNQGLSFNPSEKERKMRKSIIWTLVGLWVMTGLFACGKGGGGDATSSNQAVKRNINRFPEDYIFQLTVDEALAIRSQFVTASVRSVRSPDIWECIIPISA
jgi:Tfp pilus assembly ATPase PilU